MNNRSQTSRHFFQKGFSFVELLVVASLIIVLAGVGFASFRRSARVNRDNRREKDMQMLRIAMEQYYETYQDYPTASTFAQLLANSNFMQFVQQSSIQDPVNSGIYVYTATSNASDYQLCYQQENVSGIKCITNPQ